jgi:hypothetical protein
MPQHFHCHAVETKFPRRAFLAGLAAVAPFAARAAAALKIADVANEEGIATPLAARLAGQDVALRGYFAPSVIDGEFLLYEAPAAPCQLCGGLHDAGANLVVSGAAVPPDASMLRLIEVHGRIDVVEGRARLGAARAALV